MMRNSKIIIATILVIVCVGSLSLMGIEDNIQQKIKKAKAELQEGVNLWNAEKFKSAKDMFLNLLMTEKSEIVFFHYYIALCDYRLATYEMSENLTEEAQMNTADAQKHLEKVMELKPSWRRYPVEYRTIEKKPDNSE